MGLYNPYRVKGPLKRTNPEKGPNVDPGWVEITWDEALNTVAEKFKKIREEDPRKLLVWDGWGCTESLFITMKELERAMNYEIGGRSSRKPRTPNAVVPTVRHAPSITPPTLSTASTRIHFGPSIL
jgi:anaerobic selenocysteine-containing dehydrogenase